MIRSRQNHNQRKQQPSIDTEERNFLGKTKELEAVLGLKSERLNYKVPFDTFCEKLAEYVLKTFTSARHVIPLVEDMENPMNEFRDTNKPKIKRKRNEDDKKSEKKIKSKSSGVLVTSDSGDETDEDDGVTYYDPDDYVEKLMLDTKIKAYVAGEEELKNNISKVDAIVWGQCTSNLQAVIKGDNDFEAMNKK